MDHVLHLIELYEDNPVLWNHTMEEHKDLSALEQVKASFLGQHKTSLSQHAFDLKCMDDYASDARTKIKCKMSSDFVHEIFSVRAP